MMPALFRMNFTKATLTVVLAVSCLFSLLFFHWANLRPNQSLSTLDQELTEGVGIDDIIDSLQKQGFSYTLYSYKNSKFRVVSGVPAATPLHTFPNAPVEFLDDCNEVDCFAIRANKTEYVYILGVLRFHHRYRYLWIVHDDVVAGVSSSNGFWGFIN